MEKSIEKATPEDIRLFLEGHNDEKFITTVELDQTGDWSVDNSNRVYITIDDPKKGKTIKVDKFVPFLWTKNLSGSGLYGDDTETMRKMAKQYGISTKKLITGDDERLEDGYKYMVKTTGTYRDLINFFVKGGLSPWEEKGRELLQMLPPVEQYLVQTGKRLFKGFENYEEVHKVVFDIETTSLDPTEGHMFLIGIKDNRGFRKIIDSYENGVWTEEGERRMIIEFFDILHELNPSIICGYNSESFDWHYILGRMKLLGLSKESDKVSKRGDVTTTVHSNNIIKTKHPEIPLIRKSASLKLGAELERYTQTVYWGVNVMDTMHRVRQAMAINSNIKAFGLKYIAEQAKVERPNRVYVPGDKLGTMWVANENFNYNKTTGQWYSLDGVKPELKDLSKHKLVSEDTWEVVDGRFLITEYLLDDLLETEKVDDQYTQAAFLTAGLVPTGFLRSATMGTATLWKLLMSAWSYENGLSLPDVLPKRNFVGGLSRLLQTGYNRNIVKLDYASLYPSIQLTHGVFPTCDITGAIEAMLKYLSDTRNKYKYLMNEAEAKGDYVNQIKFDRKQLPIKVLNNSAFGSISAPYIFPWGDINVGEMITCTGRQYLRHMVQYFIDRGYRPLVLDTDGVNFAKPDDIETHEYVGRGLHRFTEEGKVYKGLDADVAEYNERFMHGAMGLDNDGEWPSTINLSRKNYATLAPNGKVKLTGNSIKSKGTSKYIEIFLNDGIKMLLDGKGKEFVDYYYSYLEKIYNQQVPLVEIANKSRVKKTIKSYMNRGTNKNGGQLPKQAHMELVIKDGIDVGLGDTIYYINNGTKKSHGDIQTKKTKVDPPEGRLVFNCYLIDKEMIEKDPTTVGEYNVAKYVDAFNKKVEPLTVVFSQNVRDSLLIDNPEDKQYFTNSELELISGIPRKEGDQDTLEELMTISEEELRFWTDRGIDNQYMINDRFSEDFVNI
jgi:DNA polymerase elongation subunit (family B)